MTGKSKATDGTPASESDQAGSYQSVEEYNRIAGARAALPPPTGEPVAWRWTWKTATEDDGWAYVETAPTGFDGQRIIEPLFAAPLQVEPAEGEVESKPVEWIWWGQDEAGKEHVSFGRWQKHHCQYRYKYANPQATEHDHPQTTALTAQEVEAALALTSQSAELASLREALKPFATFSTHRTSYVELPVRWCISAAEALEKMASKS